MKRGDTVWVLRNGEWRRGTVYSAGSCMAAVSLGAGVIDRVSLALDALDAMQALRAASEAVAKARDEVVGRSVAWYEARHTIAGAATADALEDAIQALFDAERAEAEARARLEALR